MQEIPCTKLTTREGNGKGCDRGGVNHPTPEFCLRHSDATLGYSGLWL